jgi:hypothetical protein
MAIVRPFVLFTSSALPARPVGVGLCAIVAPHARLRSAPALLPARRQRRRPVVCDGVAPGVPLCVALLLLLGAAVVAPEQPRDQEAICHRHSGVVACRVW